MLDKTQSQEAGSQAVAIQAGGNVSVNVGITYAEARSIALDVAKSTFQELTGIARETMRIRVEEITDKVIEKLKDDFPQGLAQAIDPDFQHALLTVQKEYGRTGDVELGDLLVDLLIDRSKEEQRSIMQIVLNESIITAPKLTEGQLAVLSAIFLFRYLRYLHANNLASLGSFLDRTIQSVVGKLTTNNSSFQHLDFAGCGSIGLAEFSLETLLGKCYTGLFCKGFEEFEITKTSFIMDEELFIPCLNDPTRWQVNSLEITELEEKIVKFGIDNHNAMVLKGLFEEHLMTTEEIREKVEELRPYMKDLFELWSESGLKNFNLTSVGIAIGHANIKRTAGGCGNLSIWVN